jgi:ubiquinone/menaquinone biosynthesis C-methylase UbiE
MDWLDIFGGAAPWVLAVAAIFLVVLATIGFIQGREVAIWPPRIGPRVGGGEVHAPGADQRPLSEQLEDADLSATTDVAVATPTPGRPLFDSEFGVNEAHGFYQQIASNYDLRNSSDLLRTHQAVVTRIKSVRKSDEPFEVLDLGGGTGRQIATQFFDKSDYHWTYVDFCPAMVNEFQENIRGTDLGRNVEVIVEDLTKVHRRLVNRKFDVILLSLVLSSMPAPPDFQKLSILLKPGGSLIVADINPVYTALNPFYAVMVEGRKIALQTSPVNPLGLSKQAESAGLVRTVLEGIGDAAQSYSFVEVFELPLPSSS